MNNKYIVLDSITQDFLLNMKAHREHSGVSLQQVAQLIHAHPETIRQYEHGTALPSLQKFIAMAELYDVDVSKSINYRYFHGKIQTRSIKRSLKFYGLDYQELSERTGYNRSKISEAILLRKSGTLTCLAAVLNVIEQERKAFHFREKLCRSNRNTHRRLNHEY